MATYEYKGMTVCKVTRKDWCVFEGGKVIVHEMTLKAAKAKIDEIKKQ